MILGVCLVGNQFSPQTLTDRPDPILHAAPFLITSLPFKILFQAYEAFVGFFAYMIVEFGKNFALKTR